MKTLTNISLETGNNRDLSVDWHVHSPCSCDSSLNLIQACKNAIKMGLQGICFTDHLDFDPRDEGYKFFNWPRYNEMIHSIRKKFPNLIIKSGFELNWQKKFKDEILKFIQGKKVDFILGSIHWVSTGFINEPKTYVKRSFDDFIEEWNQEAKDLLRNGTCHGFAHFDYFYLQVKNFYPKIKREDVFDYSRDVIDLMIKNNVSLEINTSAFRKGLSEPFPCWSFIKKYVKIGGQLFHFGSDSHASEQVGYKFSIIKKRLRAIIEKSN
ncbi:MAG: histidinol-phosphatase HisJ family protein [Promethearchaeota archaeon]